MILTLTDTQTDEISAKIDELHEERGEAALGRVLTLVVATDEKTSKVHCALPTRQAAITHAVSSPSAQAIGR